MERGSWKAKVGRSVRELGKKPMAMAMEKRRKKRREREEREETKSKSTLEGFLLYFNYFSAQRSICL